MSLLDSLDVPIPSPLATRDLPIGLMGDDYSYWWIEAFKDCLVDAGWTLQGRTYAQGTGYAGGWFVAYRPTIFGTIPKAGSANNSLIRVTAQNDQCLCYDGPCPRINFGEVQVACTHLCANGCWLLADCPCGHTCCTEPSPCVIHLDSTSPGCDASGDFCAGDFTGSFTSFSAALAGAACGTLYVGTPNVDGLNVNIVASQPGPEWNAPYYKTAIGVGFATAGGPLLSVFGGGYILRSQANPFNGTVYTCTVTQGIDGLPNIKIDGIYAIQTVNFDIAMEARFALASVPAYRCIANPYQFILMDLANTNDTHGAFGSGGNSILVTSPWSENPDIKYCVVISGFDHVMNQMVYESQTCWSFINKHFLNSNPTAFNTQYTGFATRNFSFAQALVTTADKPVFQNAWVYAPETNTDEASIVGKIWGGIVISKFAPQYSVTANSGNALYQIGFRSTAGPYCALFVVGKALADV